MRIALLGKSGDMLEVAKQRAHIIDEFWGVGSVGEVWNGPLHRLYEVHWPEIVKQPEYSPGYWEYLQNVTVPVYMHRKINDALQWHLGIYPASHREANAIQSIPYSRKYPLEAVLSMCENVQRPNEYNYYLTNSFDFMMAHALLNPTITHIEVYFNPQTETEYRYQREGISYWLGKAAGMERNIYLPQGSTLIRAAVYGYEEAQMVSRQTLEKQKEYHDHALQHAINTVNYLTGSLKTAHSQAVQVQLEQAQRSVIQHDAIAQHIRHQIDKCDLKETEFVIIDRFVKNEI